ncbi:tetratricopeptide repeat protein [Chitinophaga qingshengii]|uniref:Tetratricopeptide repeat protein n=1 Tax=Chitinophaga qingshengii TaxID=1569794 RepID=A0ABR7TIF9_9BACT|nr:tetratricopeptide repeat protein [Chitinophaga qingshengii]MBC9930229.1 tetratricopeptide repeat protein [Chitinophaga qingshengii]
MTSRLILCLHVVMLTLTISAATAAPLNSWYDKARDLYREGVAFRKSGQPEVARQRFAAAIRADSNYTAAYSALGDLYFEKKSYADALFCCRKAQQLGAPNMSRQIGLSYYYLHQYENALEALQQAAQEEPHNSMVPYQLAQLYAQLGNYRESIYYYQQDLRIDSTHTAAWYELGMMWFNVSDAQKAVHAFEKAARLGCRQDAVFLFNTGAAWLQLEQTEKGIDCLLKALQQQPDDEQILFNLAQAFYGKGDFEAAVCQWEKVLHLQPTNAFAMFMLGKSYMGKGEMEKGMALCDKATATGTIK